MGPAMGTETVLCFLPCKFKGVMAREGDVDAAYSCL